MIQLAVDNDAIDRSWAEFDRRAMELNRAYSQPASATASERLQLALATVAAWALFRDASLAAGEQPCDDYDPRPAA